MPKKLLPEEKKHNISRPLDKEAMVRYIVDRLTSGNKVGDVADEVVAKFKTNKTHSLQAIHESKEAIKNQMQIRVPFILSIHIERYEYLFRKFETIGRTDLMNKCLLQKEELLNLKNALATRLSEELLTQEIENKFNFKKLSVEKQNRVRLILEKGVVYA